jgi:hypothetical protein
MAVSASDANVMSTLTQKITSIMTAEDQTGSGAKPNQSFLAFCSPGVMVSREELSFGDMSTKALINANSAFSQVVNNIPNSVGFWGPTGKKVWDIYDNSINQVDLPAITLSDREAKMLKKAQDFLQQSVTTKDPFTDEEKTSIVDSAPYASYQVNMAKYQAALKTYNGLLIQANAPGAPDAVVQDFARNGASYKQQVIAAYGAWSSNGYKQYVEEAIGIIANLTGKGPASLYQSMRANFNADRLTDTLGSQFYPTYVYPKDPLNPALDGSWMSFYFNLEDVNTFKSDSATNSGGSASASWGLWSGSASASYGQGQSNYECDTSNLSLSVQLIQLPLTRPWLRPEIYWSRGWRWSAGASGVISDGGTPPQGLMPLYPTSVIVAKNLVINLDMSNTKNQSSFSKIETSASIGWGPFSVSGNYSRSDSQSTSNFTKSSTGITVPGAQIIAYVCEVLPLSPNPDPSLNWQSDAVAVPVQG